MKPDASDNRATPVPISAWCPDATSPANSTGPGRSPNKLTAVSKLLFEAGNSILTRSQKNFALTTWAMKIAKRRGLKKARVALARRLSGIMHAMLRDGTLCQA